MKRFISIVLAVSMVLLVGLNSLADTDSSDVVYVYSNDVPDSVDSFALDLANSFTPDLFEALDIDDKDIYDLKLMQGFTPYEYDSCELPVYYFPIEGNGKIIAMLKVIENGDNDYSAQIERCGIEDYLNITNNTKEDPIAFVITNEYLFSLDSNDNFARVETFWASYDVSDANAEGVPGMSFSDVVFDNGVVVEISESTARNLTLDRDAPSAVALYVPIVSNYTTQTYPNGVCWASAAASLIKYRLNTSSTAENIRDAIVSVGYGAGTSQITDNMKGAMEGYLSITMTKTTTLSFSSVKSILNSNKPIWSLWTRSGGGHCLVIRNYSVNSSGTKYFGFMDCNLSNYTVMVYGTSFTNGTYTYTWASSVY